MERPGTFEKGRQKTRNVFRMFEGLLEYLYRNAVSEHRITPQVLVIHLSCKPTNFAAVNLRDYDRVI